MPTRINKAKHSGINIFFRAAAMEAGDLFSFLDDAPADDDEVIQTDVALSDVNVSAEPKKRKAVAPNTNGVEDNEPGPSSLKRPRVEAPQALVLDEFETEAKREVAVSAGLTGSQVESGSRLELKHQVCI